jgi:sulfur relay (sulfurtransferase) complex TusBCD TusD component (DsrE family)
MPLLHRQLRERQTHTRKHVYDNLLADAIVYRAPKHRVSAQQARQERIVVSLFPVRRCVFEKQHRGLVDECEEAEVARVLARGFEDEEAFRAEGAGAEHEYHAGKC